MPPDSERFLQGCRSTQRIKTDDRALRRQADGIVHCTSGEIGQHYLGRQPEAIRIQMKPLQTDSSRSDYGKNVGDTGGNRVYETNSVANASQNEWNSTARSNFSDAPITQRSGLSTFREELNSSQNKYATTLRHLDSSFGRNAKRDLITASLPPKPAQELVWCATTIQHNALQSKGWALKLRRDS